MSIPAWQLLDPIDAVIFDCDSTLSQIEGIDQLAKRNQVTHEVRQLTDEAMNKTGITPAIYERRLALVRPSRAHVEELADVYYSNLSPDADKVIATLQSLGKAVFIISAGIQSALEGFAKRLEIPTDHVFGVNIFFDKEGNYTHYDHNALMADVGGKQKMVAKLKRQYPRIAFLGDGMNDVEAAHDVARFVGYGGAHFRESIASLCDFYITTKSLSSFLPLCLTEAEMSALNHEQKKICEKGLAHIENKDVLIKKS